MRRRPFRTDAVMGASDLTVLTHDATARAIVRRTPQSMKLTEKSAAQGRERKSGHEEQGQGNGRGQQYFVPFILIRFVSITEENEIAKNRGRSIVSTSFDLSRSTSKKTFRMAQIRTTARNFELFEFSRPTSISFLRLLTGNEAKGCGVEYRGP